MKIFHMGDWHIGKLVNGFYMTEDQAFIMEQLYEAIEREKPHVVLIAGDLYDRSVPTVQAVELLNEVFRKIVIDLKTPVIAIAGNHDSNERVGFGSELLKSSGLYLKGSLEPVVERITLSDEVGEVDFYPIPYVDPPVVRDYFKDETIKTHDDAMKKIMSEIEKERDKSKRNVAIAHAYVTYRGEEKLETLEESDSEKPLSIGGTELVDVSYFKEFNYTALGHLHGPQKVGSEKVRYSGSLMKYSFSEVNQRKGITSIQLAESGAIKLDFIPFKLRRDFRVISGVLQDIVEERIGDTKSREDYVRVELEDTGELIDPMAKLRSVYPNVMELVRKDRVRTSSENKSVASNVKERSKLSLFESFYKDIVEEECDETHQQVMMKIIEKCEKGGEEA